MTGEKIESFSGEYRWLSNFWPAKVELDGLVYPSVEHAFQAAKSLDPNERAKIQTATSAADAKRMGRHVTMRPDWDQAKVGIMEDLLAKKFADPTLAQKLLDTGACRLVEGNAWGDRFWGVCDGRGENWLGKLLVLTRDKVQRGYLGKQIFSKEVSGEQQTFVSPAMAPKGEGRVVHCKKEPYDVYIGRPSKWGNPFTHKAGTTAQTVVGSREEAVEAYREWITTQPDLMAALPELKGKTLGCWCAPQVCHGDVLVDLCARLEAPTIEPIDPLREESAETAQEHPMKEQPNRPKAGEFPGVVYTKGQMPAFAPPRRPRV
ncbi:MAG: DUF4326 domain-containing protein [Leptospirillum sp.]